MNNILVILLSTIAVLGLTQAASSRFDNIDVDSILKNPKLLNSYVNCLLETGPCNPEGRELREAIPNALKTRCASCSEKEKEIVRKAANNIIATRPSDWKAIGEKYDKDGVYKADFEKFLKGQL